MSWVIYLFGSGYAFFLGIGLIVFSLVWFAQSRFPKHRTIASLIAIAGGLLIGLSATPLPYWLYGVIAIAFMLWLSAERNPQSYSKKKTVLRVAVGLLCSIAVIWESRYQRLPSFPPSSERVLYILGDSVAAGVSSNETGRWPQLLASLENIEVVDLSHMGATVSTARREAEKILPTGGVVLLEIGGNDLLGATTASKFERDLDDLLQQVCQPDRIVLMFELPLPPLHNEWGRIQRRLAGKYSVELIPKHVLAGILSESGATLDSVHLSPNGHRRMANIVWEVIEPAFGKEK